MFCIVEFVSSSGIQECEIVPQNWIEGNKCSWPQVFSKEKFSKYVKEKRTPDKNWKTYIVRILCTTATYEKAESKMPKAYIDSNLESEAEINTSVIPNKEKETSAKSVQQAPVSPDTSDDEPLLNTAQSSSSTLYAENITFKSKVIDLLSAISMEQRENKILLQEVMRRVRSSKDKIFDKPRDFPALPCKIYHDFEHLETFLTSKNENYEYMIQHLVSIGGSTLNMLIRKMLKFCLTNEVAMLFNWKGREKKPFEVTKLKDVIFDAVKSVYPDSTDHVISLFIKDWLKYAKARMKAKNTNH